MVTIKPSESIVANNVAGIEGDGPDTSEGDGSDTSKGDELDTIEGVGLDTSNVDGIVPVDLVCDLVWRMVVDGALCIVLLLNMCDRQQQSTIELLQ